MKHPIHSVLFLIASLGLFSSESFARDIRETFPPRQENPIDIPKFHGINHRVVQKQQNLQWPIVQEEQAVEANRQQAQAPAEGAPWDVNQDGVVNIFDLVIVGKEFGRAGDNKADINGDKVVNIFDLVLVGQHFGEKTPQKQEFIPLADVEALLPKLDSAGTVPYPAARQIAQWFQEGKLDEESIQLVQQKTKVLIKELTNPDPRSTKQGRAYPIIKTMGPITTQPLIDNAFNLGANTDTRKWSLELLGHVGKFEEVFNVLLQVINGDPRFEWWHIAEAESGMEGLLERQSKDRLFELKSHPNPVVSRIATNLAGDYVPPQTVPGKVEWIQTPTVIDKLSGVFIWKKDSFATKYHVQILKKGEAKPTVDQVTDKNEYTLPSLANGEYQIRIAGANAKGEGEWTERAFKVDIGPIEKVDPVKYQNWLANNEAMSRIGIPHSFIGADPTLPDSGEGNVLKHGLVIYDWALGAEFKLAMGDLEGVKKFIEILHSGKIVLPDGRVGFEDVTAYYNDSTEQKLREHPFIYLDENGDGKPDDVDGDGRPEISKRPEGWVFKILKADGNWNETWDQWHPIAGENAHVTRLAAKIYRAFVAAGRGNDPIAQKALAFAKRNTEPALLLQQAAKNGSVPMGPIGTWFDETDPDRNQYFHLASAENNISWRAALEELYTITGEQKYKDAMDRIENYLASLWMEDKGYFAQGSIYNEITGQWESNEEFATDVQTWMVLEMGPEWVNQVTGSEAGTYKLLKTVVQKAGVLDAAGNLTGVDFNDTKTNRSIEWTAFAILANRFASNFYQVTHADWAKELTGYADPMHRAMYALRIETENTVAFHYSTQRAPTGFGWIAAGPIESLASTMAMALADQNYNPFSGEFIPLGK